jgi:hypothetical protein
MTDTKSPLYDLVEAQERLGTAIAALYDEQHTAIERDNAVALAILTDLINSALELQRKLRAAAKPLAQQAESPQRSDEGSTDYEAQMLKRVMSTKRGCERLWCSFFGQGVRKTQREAL